jgi:hypothetical protein
MKKHDPLYVVAMNGPDIITAVPKVMGLNAAILAVAKAVEKAKIADTSNVQLLTCEIRDEAFEGDAIVYRSKKTGDLVDVDGNPRLYAILFE